MDKTNRFAYANIIQLLIDITFLCLTYEIAYWIVHKFTNLSTIREYLWIIIIYIPVWISIMNLRGMYDKTTFYYLDRVLRNVSFASLISGLVIGAMLFFTKETSTSRLFIGNFVLFCIVIIFIERYCVSLIYQYGDSNNSKIRIILACTKDSHTLFMRYLMKTHIRYHIVGIVQIEKEVFEQKLYLGGLDSLEEILKNHVVDQVVFALPKEYTEEVEKYINICSQMGITVQNLLNYNLGMVKVHISMLGPLPMLTFHTITLNPVSKALKRTMDIVGALVGIAITLVVAIFLIPAIKIDSPGEVIFKQKRIGRYGRVFDCYKFRTMSMDAEDKKKELEALNEYKDALFFKIKDDPRITRIGEFLRKTSLDELPQFFNVLKGDMSLVGTRPPTMDEVAHYDIEHWRRMSIKPGITGNWQVSGRSSITDFEEVVALDTQYIDQWSMWLDICIIYKTVLLVFRRESAY
ncbi:Undecaprenyl-phosphate galactosephosphotransferase [Desulfosporosinus sp. I2]|uniref:sugar transferase n=1 Tax=Desulfosporosinus sp. I2 TaxID=1617025 RepID=UPI0005F0BC06|nr:sugar transferase [Desulfosporosinus sp. I2]KJR46665.1 Undecaprenyl-phosphate galactosephosphotransferase [Desulfosporosinus sp. I2]